MVNEFLFFSLIGLSCAGVILAAQRGASMLMALIGLLVVLMNLVVLKQVQLFGWEATTADGLGIAAGLGINLLREYGSVGLARRAIWLSFGMAAMTALIGYLVVCFVPSPSDQGHQAVAMLFLPSLRILAASLVSFLICEQFEIRWFGWLKKQWSGRHLALRHMVSLAGSQALDTALFSWLGLSGWVEPLVEIACVSYLVKLVAIAVSGPFMAVSKRFLRGPLHVAL
jgi:uncharacterized integral membrane protein (TIGR00697 family)